MGRWNCQHHSGSPVQQFFKSAHLIVHPSCDRISTTEAVDPSELLVARVVSPTTAWVCSLRISNEPEALFFSRSYRMQPHGARTLRRSPCWRGTMQPVGRSSCGCSTCSSTCMAARAILRAHCLSGTSCVHAESREARTIPNVSAYRYIRCHERLSY